MKNKNRLENNAELSNKLTFNKSISFQAKVFLAFNLTDIGLRLDVLEICIVLL